jgi:uncharacterized protein (TIGR03086 family)
MTSDLLSNFHRAAELAEQTASAVRPEQLGDPTPCTDWTVRQLLNHVVGGNLAFVSLATGSPMPDRSSDFLGADHAAALRDSIAALGAVFDEPGFAERSVSTPFGPGTGQTLLEMRFNELMIHSWDLARATGQSTDFDHDLVARSSASLRGAPMLAQARGEGKPFAAEQPAPAGSTPADELAAFVGRAV